MISPSGLLLMHLLQALLITEGLELLGALVLGVRDKRNLCIVVLVNVVTNIPLNLVLGLLRSRWPMSRLWGVLLVGEVLVVLVETWIYKRGEVSAKVNPWMLSLLLNVWSFLVGSTLLALL